MPYELDAEARRRLEAVLARLAEGPRSLTSVREPQAAWRAHVADSLTGLEVPELRAARRIADVGAGAGFPSFPLAVALPEAQVDAIESVGRKCEFIAAAAEAAGVANVRAVNARSEEWARQPPPEGGREAYDVVTARAVARLATLAELASPLLREGGVLVAWKGRRDPEEEAELGRALGPTAMAAERVLEVGELAGYEHRHLHVLRKIAPTPANLPRRPGLAKKRPIGAK